MAQLPVDAQLASFLLFAKEAHCEEEALTIAAFSAVSHLYLEAPKDHEERNEYEKIMGELVVGVCGCAEARTTAATSSRICASATCC